MKLSQAPKMSKQTRVVRITKLPKRVTRHKQQVDSSIPSVGIKTAENKIEN